ncbi:MAG: hypothetical protein LUE98_07720 [Tannerellaceae bacterium]|nr:hypothetical protein [Tannerellaceae bacterium]
MIGKTGDMSKYASLSWDELDRKGLLAELKEKDPELYKEKYSEMAKGLNITSK